MGVVGERQAALKPMARLPVSLRTGLLACLPKFHTATRMPLDDPARRTARMRPVNSRLLTRHTGRAAAHIFFFYLDDKCCRFIA